MASIFSKIIAGELPSYKVAEDDKHFAFLDIQPVSPGHVLVVPKREEDYLFDLSESELAELMAFAQKVAKRLKMAVPCKRVSVTVIGLEVPHAHVHLIPINTMDDCNFSRPKLTMKPEELQEIANRINAV
ncbi:MAG: HIT family protein [Bacteroidota bacterium]|nr:HIT family protein [Bacteroidota bacterium]MDX5430807.1 HIT family protein [Bacteroidota bacterium]MDX5469553.1 HIT family protein [Bacteroidota bacterium]